MSVEITAADSTEGRLENGFLVQSFPPRFSDWRGGKAAAQNLDERRDGVLIERPTLKMGNRTELNLNQTSGSVPCPSQSVVIDETNYWGRMNAHNRDNWWQYRVDVNTSEKATKAYKKYLINAFGSELGMNPLQKQRALRRFLQLKLHKMRGRSQSHAFIIIALITNGDAAAYGEEKVYHPQRAPNNNDPHFHRLAEALKSRFAEISDSSLTSIYHLHSQGNIKTRNQERWQSFVHRESFTQQFPSFVQEYIPEGDSK